MKKPPSNEQFVRSELSTSEDESSSQLTLTRFDHVTVGVSKTQKESTDWHIHTIIHMLMLCVPSSLLYLLCMGSGGIFSDCSSYCVPESLSVHNLQGLFLALGNLAATCTVLDSLLEGPLLEWKDHKGTFIFYSFSETIRDLSMFLLKGCWEVYPELLFFNSPWEILQ